MLKPGIIHIGANAMGIADFQFHVIKHHATHYRVFIVAKEAGIEVVKPDIGAG
jgi:hypothetical protein